jgi:hypothetical protein
METQRTPPQLRGHSLVGAQLPSAVLAGSDLRGTDFTGADLRNADLSRIRAGMSRGWTALVVLGSLVFSVGIGVIAGISTHHLRALHASGDLRLRLAGWFVTAMLVAFLLVGIAKGLRYALRTVLPVGAALAVIVGVVMVVAGLGTGSGALLALLFLAFVALVVALSVLGRAIAGTAGRVFFTLVALTGGLAAAAAGGGLGAAAIAIAAMLMAHRSAKLEAEYPLLKGTIAAIASRGGTCFRNANLAGASLADASLIACDFRGAILTGARFDGATMHACRVDRLEHGGNGSNAAARYSRPDGTMVS